VTSGSSGMTGSRQCREGAGGRASGGLW